MNNILKPPMAMGQSRSALRQRKLTAAITMGLTLAVASSAGAVDYPDSPLQSGTAYPAANIMLILDDSNSMTSAVMPSEEMRPIADTVGRKSYVQNTIYYNPSNTYEPWLKDDNTRHATGTDFTSVWSDPHLLQTATDLSLAVESFYVPIVPFAANATFGQKNTLSNYYRYQILRDGVGALIVEQSTYINKGAPGNNYGKSRCGATDNWQNCTLATPTGRSQASEIKNYATWYSYHSTRLKVAKAGASEAFGQMAVPQNLRVGFMKINQTGPSPANTYIDKSRGGNGVAFPIPVANAGGIFSNVTNRATWFTYLQETTPRASTPLRMALTAAGEYFKTSAPWGPEAGAAQYTCRQNIAILTTDGYWNDDEVVYLPSPNRYYDPALGVGDADGIAGSMIANAQGESAIRYTPLLPYSDGLVARSNTLADVAMHYWKNDLRPDMINNVPNRAENPAFWQHMTTYGVSIGLQGTLGVADLPSITNGSKVWTDPLAAFDNRRIDDLLHASVNGRGKFIVASNTSEFTSALSDALTEIADRLGSASNVTANSSSFVSNSAVYQASYTSGKWSGEVSAYGATAAGVAATPLWQASQNIPTIGRKIFTWDGAIETGAAFPTAGQTSLLERVGGVTPVSGANNAAYIAGTKTLERKNGGTLRNRDTVLGDVVNSSPIYVNDNTTLFVGANDGMMHAFDSLTGIERFAFVPAGIDFTKLQSLSDPSYTHQYFVDGPIVVSSQKQTVGKNYLVGALGRGGKGIYGLDVTTPTSFGTSDVLWQINSDVDMGQVLGTPLIVKLNNGVTAVLVSNGMNSSSGSAAMFVVNMATGAVIKKLDTGVAGDNGLSAPRGWDIDANGTVDSAYAGDLKGNLWKFDLSSANPADWNIANSGDPLFTAERSGVRQPISAGLSLAKEPGTGKLWVLFGTGRFISSLDSSSTEVQSLYGVIDSGSTISSRSDLQERGVAAVGVADGKNVRAFEPYSTLPVGKQGWYIDLTNPRAGERVDSDPRLISRAFIVSTILPAVAGDTCEGTGSGYLNALDAFTGTSLVSGFFGAPYNAGLTTAGGVVVPVGSIDLGVGMPTRAIFIDNLAIAGGSNGNLGAVSTTPSGLAARRVSWRELIGD